MPRARWLEVPPDHVVNTGEVQELALDQRGDHAAVIQRVAMHATVLGSDRSGVSVISDVWELQDDEWRVWRRHSTSGAGTRRRSEPEPCPGPDQAA